MNELIERIEAAIAGQNLIWLVRSGYEGGYFANICQSGIATVGDPDFITFRGTGRTAYIALNAAFTEYKRVRMQ